MKKTLAMLSALAMLTALAPVSAFADFNNGASASDSGNSPEPQVGDITIPGGNEPETPQEDTKQLKDDKKADTTTVNYNVTPGYTVTIPASVTLRNEDVKSEIKIEDVMLAKDSTIKVALTAAKNKDVVANSDFNVVQGDDTAVFATYKVQSADKSKDYALNEVVASFKYTGVKEAVEGVETVINHATTQINFTKPENVKYAGEYSDTLTFTISVDDPSAAVPATGLRIKYGEIENASGLTLKLGKQAQLEAVLEPENSTDTVTWSTFDESIATVDANGLVTAKSGGSVEITAKTTSGVSKAVNIYVVQD